MNEEKSEKIKEKEKKLNDDNNNHLIKIMNVNLKKIDKNIIPEKIRPSTLNLKLRLKNSGSNFLEQAREQHQQ